MSNSGMDFMYFGRAPSGPSPVLRSVSEIESEPEEEMDNDVSEDDDTQSSGESPPFDKPHAPLPHPPNDFPVRDLLLAAYIRGDLDDLPHQIAAALRDNTASTENFLVLKHCLTGLGIDFSAARKHLKRSVLFDPSLPAVSAPIPAAARELAPTGIPAPVQQAALQECLRCRRLLPACDNGPTACMLRHATPTVTRAQAMEMRNYPCCGLHAVAEAGRPLGPWESGPCFVGPHVFRAGVDTDMNMVARSGGMGVSAPELAQVAHWLVSGVKNEPEEANIMQNQQMTFGHGWPVAASIPRPAQQQSSGPQGPPMTGMPAAFLQQQPWQNPVQQVSQRPQMNMPMVQPPPPTQMFIQGSSTEQQPPTRAAPRIIETLPWHESSLYHPPGWVTFPSRARRPGDPTYV